ncbi:MAG: BACON domain-containing protein, partial [Flavobacteriaceae bacterium]|nr:BACON domain-containing protein [Flavobacteriaceae bacterium]
PSSPIEFSAKDDKSVEITVTTNQAYWDAVADASWCVITKGNDNKFTVSVQENTSKDKRKANIIVSAPNTAEIAILVEQKGAESGDGGGGGGNGGLEITLEDARRHRVMHTISYSYSGEDIGKQVNPGVAGKGVTWDFSKINLSKYYLRITTEKEGKSLSYSTSPYKNSFPDATECYMTRNVITNTYSNSNIFSFYYDDYEYLKGNIYYGSASISYTDEGTTIGITNYVPAMTEPTLYLGLKFTIETTMYSTPTSPTYPYDYSLDVEVDGEGTLILPNGKKFTDVLRRKDKVANNNGIVQYHYISKQAGEVLTLVEGNFICYTDIIN